MTPKTAETKICSQQDKGSKKFLLIFLLSLTNLFIFLCPKTERTAGLFTKPITKWLDETNTKLL